MRRSLLIAAAPLALVVSGCAGAGLGGLGGGTAPVVAGEAAPISPAERQQGQSANAGIIAEFGGAYSGNPSAYVTRVGQRVAVESGLASTPNAFTVTLLNSPVNNAFAVPGGYVYVTRNLVALMNDEAELAGVLGHEVAHVAARHSQQRQSVTQRNSILGVLGQVLVGAVAGDSGFGDLLSRGIGTGTQLLTLGYSRGQETQSDDLGIQYLASAGYDPLALSTMLESLAAQNRLDQSIRGDAQTTPEWASTHPDPASRVQRARQQAQAIAAGPAASVGTRNRDAFLAAIDGMLYGDDPRQGVIDGRDFLYPTGRVAFTIPQGFTMTNGARAVSITGPNAQAQFASGSHSGSLESYVAQVLRSLAGETGNVPQANVERTTIGGIPAAYTTVRASNGSGSQVDATVIAYQASAGQAYHFVTLTPAGQGLGAMAPMIQSFRRMTAAQAQAVRPRYLRVVTVRAGDTPASIASRMAYGDYQLERFQVLNRLSPGATLRAGDKVKIVAY